MAPEASMYTVIYDGNCNLCVTLVRVLEQLDQGQKFEYVPMQDQARLDQYQITAQDCEQGMILINQEAPESRWQGSDAAEEIGRLLPGAKGVIQTYRSLPGLKSVGDRLYSYIRDNRYTLFGKRGDTYEPTYPVCENDRCSPL